LIADHFTQDSLIVVTLVAAEGFADLGMWQEAWDTLEDLPAEERATPHALHIRLRCCPSLGAWEIGESVASLLRDGSPADRAAAANFYFRRAVLLTNQGRFSGAKEAIATAVEIWPDCRLDVLNDPGLSRLF
jgi:hypothetical protein